MAKKYKAFLEIDPKQLQSQKPTIPTIGDIYYDRNRNINGPNVNISSKGLVIRDTVNRIFIGETE